MTDHIPAAHARAAADAIRSLNHATLSPGGRDGWQYPADAYSVIAGLDQMAGGLGQSLEQVWLLLVGITGDNHIRSDRGDVTTDLSAARNALFDAHAAVDQLVVALSRAHSAISTLAWDE
ncbi:hypothetical protein EST92_25605 [Streptomyces sp. TM32]|uniref:hypothetical protein n=1 Tax=Streptomyces sp. TM32 TaxID=1652669 RepID=UPI0010134F78|nr:hypothetical protein [Streptomyces sp. TM32]RXS69391.1 hypothetical protein EST92_25605 [Streptomyces sp. TM32]